MEFALGVMTCGDAMHRQQRREKERNTTAVSNKTAMKSLAAQRHELHNCSEL